MATIHTELARHLLKGHNVDAAAVEEAKNLLVDALKFDEIHEDALTVLARLNLVHLHDYDRSEELCNQALKINPKNDDATMLLADAVVARGKVDDAALYFQQMLETQSSLVLRKNKASKTMPAPPSTTSHAMEFVSHYEALIKYIELLRRVGRLEEVEKVLEKADQMWAAVQPGGHQREPNPGLSFSRALYLEYTNHKAEALRLYSQARTPASLENPYYVRSLVHMILIYLVPTSEDLWVKGDDKTKNENIRNAEKLLLLVPHGETRQVLLGFVMLASKVPAKVESAMQIFLSIIDMYNEGIPITSAAGDAKVAAAATHAVSPKKRPSRGPQASDEETDEESDDEDALLLQGAAELEAQAAAKRGATLAAAMSATRIHKYAFLGLAITLCVLGQEQASKNIIRKLLEEVGEESPSGEGTPTMAATSTKALQFAEQDVVERAQLLDVHMDIQANRLEEAKVTLKKILDKNQSCSNAWDSQGMLQERQKQYKEASESYRRAWELLKEGDPNIGYRLALNYLKAGDAVKAIDVSRTVLEKSVNYPKIEEEVMEVAYGMLRP
ncbi:hypothetical protein AGDE_14997 [Angomonas deanei]|nr:hypothetical protein AGDE_14997 [Angomonas deanei]|eukprot:EPY19856.1 hypothetical protein AGDE_14997 [Angomonas deanei]